MSSACSIPKKQHPCFSYSVGIFETSGTPEAIVVRLGAKLGGFVVNEYNRRVRAGMRFSAARCTMGSSTVFRSTSSLRRRIDSPNTQQGVTGTTREPPTP